MSRMERRLFANKQEIEHAESLQIINDKSFVAYISNIYVGSTGSFDAKETPSCFDDEEGYE